MLLLVSSRMPVAVLLSVSVAPAMTALVWSCTVPLTVAVLACGNAVCSGTIRSNASHVKALSVFIGSSQ